MSFIRNIKKQTAHGSKDELEDATSWNRAFADLLVLIRWLDGFRTINLIATKKYSNNKMSSILF